MNNEVGTILRTYQHDMSLPENYRSYVHDVISHPCGWIKTRVVGEYFYGPEATHDMLYNFDVLPPFANVAYQARERLVRFRDAGYTAIAGVLFADGLTVKQAVMLHERGTEYINRGCLLGPYFLADQLQRGVQFFERPM